MRPAPDAPGAPEPLARESVFAAGGEMGALMRAFDWSTTPVGPVEQWPQSLRTALSILLASGYPMYIAWGPSFVQFYNDAYRPILGSTKHPAALGLSTTQTFTEIWDFIGPMFHNVLQQGATSTYADQLLPLDRNGYLEECYFDFSYSPIGDESGGVGGVFVTCSETTGRVLGERRLRTLRDLASIAGETYSVDEVCVQAADVLGRNPADLPFALIYLLDESGASARLAGASGLATDTSASPARVDLTQASVWALATVASSSAARVVEGAALPAPDLPGGAWPEATRAALATPIAERGTDRLAGVLVAGISPRRALDADYTAFLELVAGQLGQTIADARAYAAERQRAEALAELDRAKTAFFSNVSHEFRTPLTLLLGPLEDLLDAPAAPLPPAAQTSLETAHRNALRLLRLVNTLLDFSRIEAGRIQATYEPVDLASLTAELASAFRSAVERAGLAFVVDCPPLPEPVHVDREMWEKVVFNLLSNALKFTLAGQISVAVRAAGSHVELEVADTGVGIPADELPQVFERFHRVEQTRGRTQEGSGIGLALVQELVKLHGGSIAVHSTLGAGTRFTVSLPTGAAHLPPERVGGARTLASTALGAAPYLEEALRWLPDPAQADGAQPPATPRPASTAGRGALLGDARILVADDNADMRAYLGRLLGEHWQVQSVADGQTALDAARTRPPDLILTDVMMPGLDGFGLLRALRADPRTRAVPVMLLSARAGEEARVEGLQAGADDYLGKPFAARELLARVGTHLALGRLRRELAQGVAAERERLLAFLLQAPAAICILSGPEHVFTLANPRYLALVGRGEEIIGQPLRQALPELVGQPFLDILEGVRRTGTPYVANGARVLLNRATGGASAAEVYVDFIYQPIRDADGQVQEIFVHAVDVTEQKQAEVALAEEARINAALFSVGQTLAAERDLEPLVQTVTDVCTTLSRAQFGSFFYNVQDDQAESYRVYTLSGAPRAAFEQFPQPRNTAVFGPTFRGEGVVRSADITQDPRYGHNPPYFGMPEGHLPVRSYLAVPVISRTGEVLGGLFFGHSQAGVFTERAERLVAGIAGQAAVAMDGVRLLAAERAARAEAEAAVKARDEFLSIASHELRNPVAAVKVATQTLQRVLAQPAPDTARVARLVPGIATAADRLAGLLDDLLDVSRLRTGQLQLRRRPMDLAALVRQAVATQTQAGQAVQLQLELLCDPCELTGDPDRVAQVLENLLSNAAKYTPDGGAVLVRLERRADEAWLLVRDHGIGLPAGAAETIFEPFGRAENARTRNVPGLGLGLYICRQIVGSHGGRIWAESAGEGAGTSFWVVLPFQPQSALERAGDG